MHASMRCANALETDATKSSTDSPTFLKLIPITVRRHALVRRYYSKNSAYGNITCTHLNNIWRFRVGHARSKHALQCTL